MIENKKKFRKRAQNAIKGDYSRKVVKKDGRKKVKKVVQNKRTKGISVGKKDNKIKINAQKKRNAIQKAKKGGYSKTVANRILKASVLYPNDSLYQWQHGHNAKRGKK